MKVLGSVTSIFDKTVNLLAFLAAVIFIFAMLAVNFGVTLRYVLHRPQAWVVDIAAMCLIYITFLAATWLLRKEGHVTMDIAIGLLKPRTLTIINIITSLICAIMFLLFVVYGAYITWDHFLEGRYCAHTVLRIPTAYTLVIIPVGSSFLFIQLMRRAWGYYLSLRRAAPDQE